MERRRRLDRRRDQLGAMFARGVCAHFGHRYPLQPKFDQGRKPWLCPRCRFIVDWGAHPPQPPRYLATQRAIMCGLLGGMTACAVAGVVMFGWPWLAAILAVLALSATIGSVITHYQRPRGHR